VLTLRLGQGKRFDLPREVM